MKAEEARTWLLFSHLAATLYMTGVIWFVQVVHYPLFSRVGQPGSSEYAREHVRRTGRVVGGPMLAELASALAVTWVVGEPLAWIGLALVGVIWTSTWIWQVPAHRQARSRIRWRGPRESDAHELGSGGGVDSAKRDRA